MQIKARNIVTDEASEIPDGCHIEIGEGANLITVSVRDGIVEIVARHRLQIEPRVANVIHVYGVPQLR